MIWSGDKYKPWGDGVIHELPTKLFTRSVEVMNSQPILKLRKGNKGQKIRRMPVLTIKFTLRVNLKSYFLVG
jgi:hypothetical protein